MARDEFEDEGLEPEELDPAVVETTEGAWETERRETRGGRRLLLLLLVIPVVALVVVQLQPDQARGPLPAPSRSETPTWAPWPQPSQVSAGPPRVSQLREPFVGGSTQWDLFARTDRSVVRIQFPGGRVTTTPVPRLESGGPVAFVPTRSGVLVRPADSVPGYAVPDDESATRLTRMLAQGGVVLPGPEPDDVWVETGDGVHGALALVTSDGWVAGRSIGRPQGKDAWVRSDGAGYPLFVTRAGAYDARPDSLRRITSGEVVAVGPTGWLVTECTTPERCSSFVVDRPPGRSPVRNKDRHVLPGRAPHDSSGVLAPDGTSAVLAGVEKGSPRLWLLDLHSGRRRTLDVVPLAHTFLEADTTVWSPDSRWVVLVDERGRVVAVNARTRAVRHLDLHLPAVRQLAVRAAR